MIREPAGSPACATDLPSTADPNCTPMYIGVQLGSAVEGKSVAQAGLPAGSLIIAIERAGATLLPTARTVMLAGDHLSILVPGDQPETPLAIVRLCTGL